MKSDRELLELSAKAAVLKINRYTIYGPVIDNGAGAFDWNPLSDDGDAFRLANKLKLMLEISDDGNEARVDAHTGNHWTELCGDDSNAAMRRAIVNVAAFIGEDL